MKVGNKNEKTKSTVRDLDNNILQGYKGVGLNCLVLLSTNTWSGHFLLLGQSQNSMELSECLLKNDCRSLEITIDCSWKESLVKVEDQSWGTWYILENIFGFQK